MRQAAHFFHLDFVLNPSGVSCQTSHWRKTSASIPGILSEFVWGPMSILLFRVMQEHVWEELLRFKKSSKPFAKNCSFVWRARTVILALRILSSSPLLAVHVLYEQKPACPRIPETEQRWVGKLACEAPTEETLTARQDFFKKKKKKVICCAHSEINSQEFYAERSEDAVR